jgi:hypothetical protein
MRYLLLIYAPEATEVPPEEAMAESIGEYDRFTQHVRDRGALEAGEALHPTTAATTVRVVDGKTLATDGPYAETKEALGGFYLVKAADLDEAIAYAAMIPAARDGAIEVRPIFEFGDAAADGSAEPVAD